MAETKTAKKPRRKKRPEGAPRSRGIAPDALGSGAPAGRRRPGWPKPSRPTAARCSPPTGSARRQLADLRRPADRAGRAHSLPARPLRRPRRQALLGDRPAGPLPGPDDRGARRRGRRAYWTPNGNHRLAALRTLGARSAVAIVVPETEVAHRILLLNTEKAHNLRERSLEVVRLAQSLAELEDRPEREFETEFEEPALLTLGLLLPGERPLRRRRLPSGAPARREVPRRRRCPRRWRSGASARPGCWSWMRRWPRR